MVEEFNQSETLGTGVDDMRFNASKPEYIPSFIKDDSNQANTIGILQNGQKKIIAVIDDINNIIRENNLNCTKTGSLVGKHPRTWVSRLETKYTDDNVLTLCDELERLKSKSKQIDNLMKEYNKAMTTGGQRRTRSRQKKSKGKSRKMVRKSTRRKSTNLVRKSSKK